MPLVVGLVGAIGSSPSPADTSSPPQALVAADKASPAQGLLTDDFVVSLGGYLVATSVDASLNGHTVSGGTPINFGETFGTGGDYTRIRADALWRINPRHHIRFLYFNNSVTRTRTIDRAIDWGDYTFQVNSSVQAHSAFKAYELAYEYAFVIRPDYEIAASAGVHYMDMSFKLSGTATITDANGVVTGPFPGETSTSNLPAPFPVIGLRGGWAVTPSIYLDAQAQVFKFSYDGYNGRWSDLRVGATWMFSRHFGVGTAYNRFHVNADVSKAQFHGNLTLGYQGVLLFLTGSF